MRIYTASYRKYLREGDPETQVPVRTSVGRPRFWPANMDMPALREATPYGIFGEQIEWDEYIDRYYERLEEQGLEQIRSELETIAGDKDVVLLCYENDPEDCHRSLFGKWWEKQTGETVEELGAPRQLRLEDG